MATIKQAQAHARKHGWTMSRRRPWGDFRLVPPGGGEAQAAYPEDPGEAIQIVDHVQAMAEAVKALSQI